MAIMIAGVLAVVLIVAGMILQKQKRIEDFFRKYPLKYTDEIRMYAEENGLEPAYVAAVVLAESSYDPEAISSVGAQGLMQIMPETAEWIAGHLKEDYIDGCLFEVETNLRYGCWYMGYLMRRYDNDKKCCSSAYHSGQGTVDKWLKNPEYSADGRTLDVIGGENAKLYVGRVLDYYEVYTDLYEKS